jgi:hypothetical protein
VADGLAAEEADEEANMAMSDAQYMELTILLQTKKLTRREMEIIDECLYKNLYPDWDVLIAWLWEKDNLPLKLRKRRTNYS